MKTLKMLALALVILVVLATPVFAQTGPSPSSATLSGSSIGAGIGVALAILGAGIGFGKIGGAAVEGMARQPEAAAKIQTAAIIIGALLEGATFFGLLVCILINNQKTWQLAVVLSAPTWLVHGEVVMYRWVALLLLVSASPAYAEGGGPFSGALDLTIWTWVVFLLLFFILKKYAWGPMLEGLKKREDNIHQAMHEAKHAREEAQQLRNQLQAEVSKAHETVRAILDEARKDAQHAKEEMVGQARKEIQEERDRLRREIEMTRDQALQELWNRTAELATQISSKAIRRSLSTDDHQRLVDEALAGLGQAGKEYRN